MLFQLLFQKLKKQKEKNKNEVNLLGTGKPLREFIHSDDLADAIIICLKANTKLLKKFKSKLPIMNVGTNEEISIKNLSKLIAKIIRFEGKIKFDLKSPDGTYRKGLDLKKIRFLGGYQE